MLRVFPSVELCAESLHKIVDRSTGAKVPMSPDRIQDRIARQDTPLSLNKETQEIELFRGKLCDFALNRDVPLLKVYLHGAECDQLRRGLAT